jgi:hypothetical protein
MGGIGRKQRKSSMIIKITNNAGEEAYHDKVKIILMLNNNN